MGWLSIWHWLVLLLLLILIFGSKRIRGLASDLGSAIKGFTQGLRGIEQGPERSPPTESPRHVEKRLT